MCHDPGVYDVAVDVTWVYDRGLSGRSRVLGRLRVIGRLRVTGWPDWRKNAGGLGWACRRWTGLAGLGSRLSDWAIIGLTRFGLKRLGRGNRRVLDWSKVIRFGSGCMIRPSGRTSSSSPSCLRVSTSFFPPFSSVPESLLPLPRFWYRSGL